MKILQINAVFGYGSTGKIVEDIGKALKKHNIGSYYAFQSGIYDENSYVFNSKIDRYFHGCLTRITGKQGFYSKLQTKKFIYWIDNISPDIIHLHNLHSNFINIPLLLNYIQKKEIPLVITLHDCWFITGKCTHFSSVNCNKWKTGCGKCPQLHKHIFSFVDNTNLITKKKKKLFEGIKSTIVGCSYWITNIARESYVFSNNKFLCIHNGVDCNVFTPTEKKYRFDNNLINKFVILGFANKWRLPENKDAVNSIIENFKNNSIILLVGCNESDKKMFNKYSCVMCIGFIKNQDELADIYSSSDVFINLSHEDTFPTVNMESICCGTPVVCYKCTGCSEIVFEDCGYSVEENDYEKMIYLVETIRKKGFVVDVEKYSKVFSNNVCYEKYVELYKEITA